MAWSGHRTRSMLQRYNVLDLSDLRRAGKMASDYGGQPATVTVLPPNRQRSQNLPSPQEIQGSRRTPRLSWERANNAEW